MTSAVFANVTSATFVVVRKRSYQFAIDVPANRTEWTVFLLALRVVQVVDVARIIDDAQLSLNFVLPFQFRNLAAKTIIFLNEFDDVGVETQDPLVKFEVVNLFNRFGNLFCIIEYAHVGDFRTQKGRKRGCPILFAPFAKGYDSTAVSRMGFSEPHDLPFSSHFSCTAITDTESQSRNNSPTVQHRKLCSPPETDAKSAAKPFSTASLTT